MQTTITGRHMEVTEAMRGYIEKKITRLSKYHNRISAIEVILSGKEPSHKTEIIITVDHHQPFVVNEVGEDMYACFDKAVDKVERQMIRHKEKARNHKGHTGAAQASMDALESREDKV